MPISNDPLKRCSTVAVNNEISKSDGEYVDVTKVSCPDKGMRLAVIPFLSNNGKTISLVRCCTGEPVGFDVILGKHLLICCVSLPLSGELLYLRAIMEVYNTIPQDKFEMVIVASSDSNMVDFAEFVSELPCLAIPFSDIDTRHYICSFIGFYLYLVCPKLSAILVDPNEIIMHYRITPESFFTLGSEWFPYHHSDIKAMNIQDDVLRCRLDPFYKKEIQERGSEAVMQDALLHEPLSLYRDILLCDPSLALPRIGSVGGAHETLTVSELSKKHVVLYLYLDRGLLGDLVNVHQECIEKKLELEIVLVFIPFFSPPDSFQEKLFEDLRRENITSWLVFPQNNNIWRRLWRVFSMKIMEDRMIILPPNGQFGELAGRAVVEECGIEEYPFKRSTILERRFTALRSLTPSSLFKGISKNRTSLVRKGKKCNVRQSSLRGKRLLVYLDWLQLSDDNGKLCDLMMDLYPKIKAMGWEVVFVPLDQEHTEPHVKLSETLWPTMPIREAWKASVRDKLIFGGDGNQVIAFREDGKIVSRQAVKSLMKHELDDSLFFDKLYEELSYILVCLG